MPKVSGRLSRCWQWVAIAIAALLLMLAIPAMAQSPEAPAQAPVIVDGQVVFQVGGFGQFTAEERADLINSQLETAVRSEVPVRFKVEERNKQPAIVANGRYLMTITEQDLSAGNTPEEQAEIWSVQLRRLVWRARQQRRSDYLWRAGIQAAIAVLITILIHWSLGRLWRYVSSSKLQFLNRTTIPPNVGQSLQLLLKLSLVLVRAGLWLLTTLYVANLFPLSRQWSYRITSGLGATFTIPLLSLGQRSYSVIDFLILLAMFWGLVIVAGMAMELLRSRLLNRLGIARGTQEVVAVIARYSLIAFGTIVLLQVWGLDLSSLTILGGALGVGIGFGFQDIAKNFGSGLVLLFERSIQAGDFIEVGDRMGTVKHIGARSIVLRTLDRISVIVPNSQLLENEVINWSHDNPVSRLHLFVGVAYGSELAVVKSALLQAAREHPEVLQVPSPDVIFIGFGDSSLDFELRVWITEPDRQILLKSDLYFRIDELLRQHEIEIPFPQHDLHLRSDSMPVGLSPKLEEALLQWLHQLNR